MIDRNTISRTIMNILDVHRSYDYKIFNELDMSDKILQVSKEVTHDDPYALDDMTSILIRNKRLINKIVNNRKFSINEYNIFMEDMRGFRRKYIIQKKP